MEFEKLLKQMRKMNMENKFIWFQAITSERRSSQFVEFKNYISSLVKTLSFEQIHEGLSKELFTEFSFFHSLGKLNEVNQSEKLEELGKITTDDEHDSLLIYFLQNSSSDLVKEGAIYGLAYHMDNEIVYNRMKEALSNEFISPLIKEIIRDTLQIEDEIRNGK